MNGGFRLGSLNNWVATDQRQLNFVIRSKYGDDVLNYDLFPGTGVTQFTGLAIREGGDDDRNARMADAVFKDITYKRLEVEANAGRPAVVLINGQYWGHYNIRDRWDDHWFFQNYGTDDGAYDHLNLRSRVSVDNGSSVQWDSLLEFIDSNDVTDPSVWSYIESKIDVTSFIDYVICEAYAQNTSWDVNIEFWRDHSPGSKWRWFVPDMDRTFGNSGGGELLTDMWDSEILLERINANPTFRARLAQRGAAHLATTFATPRIHSIIDKWAALIGSEMPRQEVRWPNSYSEYSSAVEDMKSFASTSPASLLSEMASVMSLSPAVPVSLISNGQGFFEVEGVPIPASTINLFPNLPVTLRAVAAPGYAFDSWTGIAGGSTTTVTLTGAQSITANFVPASGTVLNGSLISDTTLIAANSPYIVEEDLIVAAGVTVTVEAGVVIELKECKNIRVQGTLTIQGTSASPVTIQGYDNQHWGGISFEQPSTTSALAHVIIRDATRGHDPSKYPSAISGLDATVELDFIDISDSLGPLFFRGGSTLLRDSTIHIPITGDGINIKQGYAETHRTTFLGNSSPDTDAIDYDGVVNGIIQDCRLYNFSGFNSDGIDVGEQATNILIHGNYIFYNSDKGVSVGQGSTVTMTRNLIVGCAQGVGIKDTGSEAIIDQNTFVDCDQSIAVFEKNFGAGGGSATVTNTIISRSAIPVSVDALSSLSVSYSLSDTVPLSGINNLNTSPLFNDPDSLDFSLDPASPAIDTGDPAHPLDPDFTRADRGALYAYSPMDYPFAGRDVVVNEVLANSGSDPDWIELHNRTASPVDIGGWFLSDTATDLAKYRIPLGTVIPGEGFIVFYEDANFGVTSLDPNKLTGFALSDDGETIYLSSAVSDQLTYYRFKEDFGPSLDGETQGYYFKPSTNTYNFVPLAASTIAAANTPPRVGPIVISEIMYHPPAAADSEYIELLNVSDSSVTLFDSSTDRGWAFTSGIEFEFPTSSPVTMAPGERVIVTRNLTSFLANFAPPASTQLFQWTAKTLDNGGEAIELGRPGPVDAEDNVQFVRVDRVNYDDMAPWSTLPDGAGLALSKIAEAEYGNDYVNWAAQSPNPGTIVPGLTFASWAATYGLTDPALDPDHDDLTNLMEYALQTDPTAFTSTCPLVYQIDDTHIDVSYSLLLSLTDIDTTLQTSSNLVDWNDLLTTGTAVSATAQTRVSTHSTSVFPRHFRLHISLKP